MGDTPAQNAASKRQPPPVVDPRPSVDGTTVLGIRCTSCSRPSAFSDLTCRHCGGSVEASRFGPGGEVWAVADVHLRVGPRTPPFTLAYVDLIDGPRVLARVTGPPVATGDAVRIIGTADDPTGDLLVEASNT